MLNLILVFPLLMELLFNSGSLLLDGTQLILLTLPTLTLFAKATLLVTELNKLKPGLNWLHMVQTILLPTQQIVLQLLKLLLTRQLLTSGLMLLVKVKMPQMDSGTLLAKVKDYSTVLMQNSKTSLTTVQLRSKLVINSLQRMELFSVLNHQWTQQPALPLSIKSTTQHLTIAQILPIRQMEPSHLIPQTVPMVLMELTPLMEPSLLMAQIQQLEPTPLTPLMAQSQQMVPTAVVLINGMAHKLPLRILQLIQPVIIVVTATAVRHHQNN